MLHTKFQASEPSGSEEDFLIFLFVFLRFETKTPWRKIWLLGSLLEQTW